MMLKQTKTIYKYKFVYVVILMLQIKQNKILKSFPELVSNMNMTDYFKSL